MLRRPLRLIAVASALLLALAVPAAAHVNVEPGEAVAGSTTTLTFSFHHGKDGAATTALEVRLPSGTTVVDIPEVAGFTSAVDAGARTVRWSGGSVPDGTEARFPLVVELPATPGVALFPAIQETPAGELAWVDEEEGHGEDANPAPRLTLVADPAATTTSEGTSTTAELPGTTLEAEERDDGDGSPAPWLIGSGLVAAIAIAVGGTLLKRRTG